jgi:hypothetical protein
LQLCQLGCQVTLQDFDLALCRESQKHVFEWTSVLISKVQAQANANVHTSQVSVSTNWAAHELVTDGIDYFLMGEK